LELGKRFYGEQKLGKQLAPEAERFFMDGFRNNASVEKVVFIFESLISTRLDYK
jgi:hypothetical protein